MRQICDGALLYCIGEPLCEKRANACRGQTTATPNLGQIPRAKAASTSQLKQSALRCFKHCFDAFYGGMRIKLAVCSAYCASQGHYLLRCLEPIPYYFYR